MVRKIVFILSSILFSISIAHSQDLYYVIFKSLDGKSNVVGGSFYPGEFVTTLPEDPTQYVGWFETSLSTQNISSNKLQKEVLLPILGSPSNADKVYLRFRIKSQKDKLLQLELVDILENAFVTSPDDTNYFYILIKGNKIEADQQKAVFATFSVIKLRQ